ncbi:cysteine--tRNA ligase [archaeon]|jgi:cysteinyl-tRNA synthetase|nr:cysteine--tRNA ligase [archaeon]MBT4022755.1 cysteine--tRNA ligase [archaeon]MBT4273051.1 cysteine--tRNA ligase [archaeon]MBT4461032.1 cysteine--tRNA ligase [archaeon]MBT4858074.1 cysteine--tRNA ligase [archaeon]
MVLKFYNTLSKKKEEFNEINKGKIKIYTCGPTVYNYAHIGNWRSFVFSDILRRYLKYKGYDVMHVMNLTDVDDKTIRDSQKQSMSLKEFTEKYSKIFFEDMDILNIERVEEYPKATESIKEMLDITKKLIEKGIAYKSEDGSVYYSVTKFKDYGKLAGLKLGNLKAGARVKHDEYEKESANDFALWKAYEETDGDVFWETEFGKGRPGWHIECSAMSSKFLGNHFDIHTGGIDLKFPHHENEIAQSEGCSGEKFVNYWLHSEHLLIEGEKMSKSKGNFYIIKDLLDKGHSPKALRYMLLSTHYRQKVNFTFESFDAAENIIKRFKEFLLKLKSVKGSEDNSDVDEIIINSKKQFENSMDDDLNISGGLAALFEFMTSINKLMSEEKLSRNDALKAFNLMMEFDTVIGLFEFKEEDIPKEILEIVKKREEARKNKDWALSDKLRDEVKDKGFEIEDTKEGSVVKKI